jgi:hypothetical protein
LPEPLPFIYDPEIPAPFALLVFEVLRRRATDRVWSEMVEYHLEDRPVFDWIESILADNNIEGDRSEIGWWFGKLIGN